MAGPSQASMEVFERKDQRNLRAKLGYKLLFGREYHYYENQDMRETVKHYLTVCTDMENVDVNLLSVVYYDTWMLISQAGDSSQALFMKNDHCPELVAALIRLNIEIKEKLKEDGIPKKDVEPSLVYVGLRDRTEGLTEEEFKRRAISQLVSYDNYKLYAKCRW